jgi:hypothetical protein
MRSSDAFENHAENVSVATPIRPSADVSKNHAVEKPLF